MLRSATDGRDLLDDLDQLIGVRVLAAFTGRPGRETAVKPP